jgi:hypothetical protein
MKTKTEVQVEHCGSSRSEVKTQGAIETRVRAFPAWSAEGRHRLTGRRRLDVDSQLDLEPAKRLAKVTGMRGMLDFAHDGAAPYRRRTRGFHDACKHCCAHCNARRCGNPGCG